MATSKHGPDKHLTIATSDPWQINRYIYLVSPLKAHKLSKKYKWLQGDIH